MQIGAWKSRQCDNRGEELHHPVSTVATTLQGELDMWQVGKETRGGQVDFHAHNEASHIAAM